MWITRGDKSTLDITHYTLDISHMNRSRRDSKRSPPSRPGPSSNRSEGSRSRLPSTERQSSTTSPLSDAQKAALIANTIIEEEEEVSKHRIGAVYADPAVRRRLANGQGPTNHARTLETQYNQLLAKRRDRRQRARSFRRNVGRVRGPDRNVQAELVANKLMTSNVKRKNTIEGERKQEPTIDANGVELPPTPPPLPVNVSDLLSDVCFDIFSSGSAKQELFASDIPSGTNPLDSLPIRDYTQYNAKSGHGLHHGGSHRRQHGHHHQSPIGPPPKPPHSNQTPTRGRYGTNRYGKAPIPIIAYDTGADSGLQKECVHYATYGSHHHADKHVLRSEQRRPNMGASTLAFSTATRMTSPRDRLITLKQTGQVAKQVVFRNEVEEAAVDFLACASVKKKYVPPGAQKGSTSVFAQKLWQAMKKTPSIVQFWTHTIAEKFARSLFSDREYSNLKACKTLRKAFAIGTKVKSSYSAETILNNKMQRIERIHAVVQTPCLIDRLVEFVANVNSSESIVTEASICLAAIVCSDNYNEEHVDEVLRCIVDRGVCPIFLDRVTKLVDNIDDRYLPMSELPSYLKNQEDVDGDGIIDEDEGEPMGRLDGLGLGGAKNDSQLHDFSQHSNNNLIVKCSLGHICSYDKVENFDEWFCDSCGDALETEVTFTCMKCEWCLCGDCLDQSKLPTASRDHGGVTGSKSRPGTTNVQPLKSREKASSQQIVLSPSRPSTTVLSNASHALNGGTRGRRRFKFTTMKMETSRPNTATSEDARKEKLGQERGEKEEEEEEEEDGDDIKDFTLDENKGNVLYRELGLAAAALGNTSLFFHRFIFSFILLPFIVFFVSICFIFSFIL
jgi:hypothetical protein